MALTKTDITTTSLTLLRRIPAWISNLDLKDYKFGASKTVHNLNAVRFEVQSL